MRSTTLSITECPSVQSRSLILNPKIHAAAQIVQLSDAIMFDIIDSFDESDL